MVTVRDTVRCALSGAHLIFLPHNEDLIKEVKFITTYENKTDSYFYGIGTITLENAINVKEISKNDIANTIKNSLTNATYSMDYLFNYMDSIQSEHKDLAKAILTACGHTLTEGSTILFVDERATADGIGGIGEAHEFTVAEITDKGVQEYTIRVKEASTDQGYINNINEYMNNNTPGYFYLRKQHSQTLSENIVKEQAQENEVETTSYRYIVDFGDDERAEVLVC